MKRLTTILAGVFIASSALAAVPAATELPITLKGALSITPGEAKAAKFLIAKSDGKTTLGEAARSLAGCDIKGDVQLDGKSARLLMKGSGFLLCVRKGKTESYSGGGVEGQFVGLDGVTGIPLECKGKPDCLVGALKAGAKASFVLTKPIQ